MRVTAAGVADTFAANTILLGGEGKGQKGDRGKVTQRTGERVNGGIPGPEGHIAKAKEVVPGGARGAGVFAGPQKKVESEGDAIGNGTSTHSGRVCTRERCGNTQEGEGQGGHASGSRVGFAPGAEEGREAVVQSAEGIQARVRGPQPGERLTHRSYGVLHRPRSDGEAAGGKDARTVSVGKELKKRDAVMDCGKSGVVAKAGTKGRPEAPGGVLRGAAVRRDAGTDRLRDRAPITACSRAGGSWQMRQEAVWG